MREQVRLNHSADDVDQMRKDWAESFHFDAPADLPGLLDDYDALHAEAEALRGLTPELPPRPPEGAGLPRYGLRWNGPAQPLSVPMDDGYWTPWHLAEALRAEIEEMDALLNRQADLLRQTAIALRGPEPDLTRYSHSDIPTRATTAVAELDALRAENAALRESSLDVRSLVEALEECAGSLAWNCFGECRAVHAGPIMPAAMALDTARAALATYHQDT